jgi:2-keto-4-pentenoate hydratase/2-oxohepta-3-ene-1,7-dioic acid hydratase in catechol pathway
MWVPSRPSLDSLPEVTLATFVRGERRQQAHSTALAVPVRVLLSAAMKRAGRGLRAGEVVLTGTPSGIALKVPAWKRALGRRFLDRFARAEAAFGLYTSAPEAFLTPGSAVTVEAGFLGRRTIVVA